jgi:hypothetical protein
LSVRFPGASLSNVLRETRGQAAVEFLAVLPALILAGLIAWELLLVGHTAWLAADAARVGARAGLVGADTRRAAASALPARMERGLEVGRTRTGAVRVRVPVPVGDMFEGDAAKVTASASLEGAR